MADPLKPDIKILVKLGSIAIHAEEFIGDSPHNFDKLALEQILGDPVIIQWLRQMDALALIPKKRQEDR